MIDLVITMTAITKMVFRYFVNKTEFLNLRDDGLRTWRTLNPLIHYLDAQISKSTRSRLPIHKYDRNITVVNFLTKK